MTSAAIPHGTGTRRIGTSRRLYLVAGAVLTAAAVAAAVRYDTGVSSILIFAVLPDLALLAAIGQPHAPGQLPRRAVPLYNLLHHPTLPFLLVAGVATGMLGRYWLVAGLAWAAHIAFDRASGYGLRTPEGWQRG